ncbi:AAA family ATPase [Niveibacterium sp. 24ML]|uniref:ExeA family protein n=1 Tax=Niveibacterium sp. 24ML TaxID=2985512 RepID=UPI00226D9178|nr:AAA family ATPase [Niveibacterium sp. 24ML]MCX9154845.1 AAA family ATPase [Niveibacterium sp. 24ML]
MSSTLYLEHFGLDEAPFRITANPDYFFAGAERGATLEALLFALRFEEGVLKVTGEVGAGKTMLLRMLLEKLSPETLPIWLANPSLPPDQLLRTIATQIGAAIDENPDTGMLDAIQQRLITLYGEARRIILLVDEAHAMPATSLEQVRLLSNLETPRHKLLQVVLFGQPELDQLLATDAQRALRDRITHHFQLAPLTTAETHAYIYHRLLAAGHRGRPPFSTPAMSAIARSAKGLTRRINVLADKAMLAAFAAGKHDIGLREVRLAARDAAMPDPLALRSASLALLALLLPAALGAWWWQRQPAPAPAPGPGVLAHPTVPHAPRAQPPAALAAPVAPAPFADILGGAIANRLQASRNWVSSTDGKRWTIQIGAAAPDKARGLETLIAKAESIATDIPVHLYVAPGKPIGRIGVVWGDFASAAEARQALASAPDWLRNDRPYVRPLASIRPARPQAMPAKAVPVAAEANSVKMRSDPTAP